MLSCDWSSLLCTSNSSVKHLSELCGVPGNILSLGSTPRVSGFSLSAVGLKNCISNKFLVILLLHIITEDHNFTHT